MRSRTLVPIFGAALLVGSAAGPVPTACAEDAWLSLDLASTPTATGLLERLHGSNGVGDFGVPVAAGHDCDGDGNLDYAMASMLADPGGQTDAGEVFLVFGNGSIGGAIDTATTQASILRIQGEVLAETAGNEIWMEDVTGDGLGDLLIGRQNYAPDPSRPGAGAVSVVVGGDALATHAATLAPLDLGAPPASIDVFTIVGAASIDRLGIWMRADDVTGDGINDLLVGADQEDLGGELNRGAAYLVRGGAHLAATATVDLASFGSTSLVGDILKIRPPAGSDGYHFGATCQVADLDGNGKAEMMAAAALTRSGASLAADGAPIGSAEGAGGAPDGSIFIFWDDNVPAGSWAAGLTIDFDTASGTTTSITGGASNVRFGEEILGGRDYDNDGNADLFIGDIVADLIGGRPNSGSGHIFYDAASLKGLDFNLDSLPGGVDMVSVLGGLPGNIAGDTALHGDFDGDGLDDLAIGSPHDSPFGRVHAGAVHILFGQNSQWPSTIDLAPGALPASNLVRITQVDGANGRLNSDDGDTLIYSAAAADMDGDGLDDLVINEMRGNGVDPLAEDVGNLIVLGGAFVSGVDGLAFCDPVPAVGCKENATARSILLLRDSPIPAKDLLLWKWNKGDETLLADYQDPVNGPLGYRICLYDGSGSGQPLLNRLVGSGGSCDGKDCWKASGTKGFGYKSKSGSPGGILQMKMKVGAPGRAKFQIKAGRDFLSPPAPALTLPVTAQMIVEGDSGSTCWQTVFSNSLKNGNGLFKAKGP